MSTNAVSEDQQAEVKRLLVGKTIVGIDTEAINAWHFDMSDGTEVLVENVDFHIHPGLHKLVCKEVGE